MSFDVSGGRTCPVASLEAIVLLARVAGLRGKKEEVLHRVGKLKASGPNAVH